MLAMASTQLPNHLLGGAQVATPMQRASMMRSVTATTLDLTKDDTPLEMLGLAALRARRDANLNEIMLLQEENKKIEKLLAQQLNDLPVEVVEATLAHLYAEAKLVQAALRSRRYKPNEVLETDPMKEDTEEEEYPPAEDIMDHDPRMDHWIGHDELQPAALAHLTATFNNQSANGNQLSRSAGEQPQRR